MVELYMIRPEILMTMDPLCDSRVKNRLEKQDEIEVSDEEDTEQPSYMQEPRLSKNNSTSPVGRKPVHEKPLPKQTSEPANGIHDSVTVGNRKSSVPVAHVHVNHLSEKQRRNELTAPRHLGSLAFSSISTEESSSICDSDGLSRQMGSLSLQGSFQDEASGKPVEEYANTTEFLLATWYRQPRDRPVMLHCEKTLESLLSTKQEEPHTFEPHNSYYRMLIHRIADVWGFEHSTCTIRNMQGVVVKLSSQSQTPEQLFRDLTEQSGPEEPGRIILKRPKTSASSSCDSVAAAMQPSRSIPQTYEQREARYNQVRQRIFGQNSDENDEPEPPKALSGSFSANRRAQNRSRNPSSDMSQDYSTDESQNRLIHQPPVRQMAPNQFVYGNTYMYNPIGQYQSGDGNMMNPAAYPQFYMGLGPQSVCGYHAMPAPIYPQQLQQMGYAQQAYIQSNQLDAQHQHPMYDSSGQYLHSQYPGTNVDVSHQVNQVSGYVPVQNQIDGTSQSHIRFYSGYDISVQQQPGTDPRFGAPIIQQDAQRTGINDTVIIPLRLPVAATTPGLNMYLKLPYPRGASPVSNEGNRPSSSSPFYKQEQNYDEED